MIAPALVKFLAPLPKYNNPFLFREVFEEINQDQKDENGIIHSVRTSESEDTFCEICDDVEEIMSRVFEKVDA